MPWAVTHDVIIAGQHHGPAAYFWATLPVAFKIAEGSVVCNYRETRSCEIVMEFCDTKDNGKKFAHAAPVLQFSIVAATAGIGNDVHFVVLLQLFEHGGYGVYRVVCA